MIQTKDYKKDYDDLFKSNWYICCKNCFTCSKYEINSWYHTLSCTCNSLKLNNETGYWIQHNQSNWYQNRVFFISPNSLTKDTTDIEEYSIKTIEGKEQLALDLKQVINKTLPQVLNEFKEKRKEYLNSVKELALTTIEQRNLEYNEDKERRFNEKVQENIKILETHLDFKDKKHLVLGDLHNRVSYLKSAIILAKKYNLELTLLWDYLDRDIGYFDSDAKRLIEILLEEKDFINISKDFESKNEDYKYKINLIIWNHDAYLMSIIEWIKNNDGQKVKIKDKDYTSSELLFLIWTKENNGGLDTLKSFWIYQFYWIKDELLELPEWFYERFKLEVSKEENGLNQFSNLLKEKGFIAKILINLDKKYFVSHHWIAPSKVESRFNSDIIQAIKKWNEDEKKKLAFVCWQTIVKKEKDENWNEGHIIKVKYDKNTTFEYIGRNYNKLSKKKYEKLLETEWLTGIIVWHDNQVVNIEDKLIWLDNTWKEDWGWKEEIPKIVKAFYTF